MVSLNASLFNNNFIHFQPYFTSTMRKIFLSVAALAVICITMNACKPADSDNPTPTGKVKLEFNNVVGGSNLNMNSQWYKNAHGDSFQVSKFNYYISNIQLNGPDGATYTEADSYHLLQQSDAASLSFDMALVPAKRYNSITLTIGVDSLHNVSGAQQGALDPSNGMYWSWNTGYIMLKFEGISPQSTEAGGMRVCFRASTAR